MILNNRDRNLSYMIGDRDIIARDLGLGRIPQLGVESISNGSWTITSSARDPNRGACLQGLGWRMSRLEFEEEGEAWLLERTLSRQYNRLKSEDTASR